MLANTQKHTNTHTFTPTDVQIHTNTYTHHQLLSTDVHILEWGKNWLPRCQDNVTDWDMVLAALSPSGVTL